MYAPLRVSVSVARLQHGASPEQEGEVCNHLIQTYTRGISLPKLTVPFEPYLVSISLTLVWSKVQKLDSFCLEVAAIGVFSYRRTTSFH